MKPQLIAGLALAVMLSPVAAQDNPVQVRKSDSLSKFEYDKYVAAGKKTLLGFSYAINPDCTSAGPIDFKVTIQPTHGTIEIVDGKAYPNFPPENARAKCNAERAAGILFYYKPADGYTGADAFDVSSLMPGGFMQEAHYNVHVR